MRIYSEKMKELKDKKPETITIRTKQESIEYSLKKKRQSERNILLYKYDSLHRFNVYKKMAKKRKLEFILSFEQSEKLFNQPCWYCGYKSDKLNGIDRIDANKGYNPENCISCCKVCNYMKGVPETWCNFTQNDFLNQVKKIYENRIKT